jgi:hypothetical protein
VKKIVQSLLLIGLASNMSTARAESYPLADHCMFTALAYLDFVRHGTQHQELISTPGYDHKDAHRVANDTARAVALSVFLYESVIERNGISDSETAECINFELRQKNVAIPELNRLRQLRDYYAQVYVGHMNNQHPQPFSN